MMKGPQMHARVPRRDGWSADRAGPGLLLLSLAGALLLGCDDGRDLPADSAVHLPDAGPGTVDLYADAGNPAPDLLSSPDGATDQIPGPCNKPGDPTLKYTPGVTYWGRKDYIEYVAGDLPVIISSPHGGYLKPSEIPDRTYGVLGMDSNSQEYTFEAARYLKAITGRSPHLIINRLHRIKLDANREIKEAAQGSKYSEQAWTEYHQYIEAAKKWVTTRCGKGLYLDHHTNAHSEKWVELGMLLPSSDLALSDSVLNQPTYINKSSIRAISLSPGRSFVEILRGQFSLGGLLMNRGYKSVPSPKHPDPADGGFFSGGYNTWRHGSKSGGAIDGIQVETYYCSTALSTTMAG